MATINTRGTLTVTAWQFCDDSRQFSRSKFDLQFAISQLKQTLLACMTFECCEYLRNHHSCYYHLCYQYLFILKHCTRAVSDYELKFWPVFYSPTFTFKMLCYMCGFQVFFGLFTFSKFESKTKWAASFCVIFSIYVLRIPFFINLFTKYIYMQNTHLANSVTVKQLYMEIILKPLFLPPASLIFQTQHIHK